MFIFTSKTIHFQTPTPIFLLTCLLLHLPLLLSNAANSEDQYSACSTLYSCGKIKNIGYPFWGGNRPDYCGTPNFKLNCLEGAEYPTMIMYSNGSIGFNIVGINTYNHTILVSRDKLLHNCFVQNTSKINLISNLKEDGSYNKINLFYGCNNNDDYCNNFITNHSKAFPCYNSDNTPGYVYYFEGNKNLSCSCTNQVSVPLDDRLIEELSSKKNVSLWKVLTELPVKTVYNASFKECATCEESGGRCGSSGNNFMCYCKNGAYPLICSQSSGGRQRKLEIILGTGAAVAIMVLVALFISAYYKYRTNENFTYIWGKTSEDQNVEAFLQNYGSLAPKRYTYREIRKMTNSFKDKLGEGGYGVVYKGRLPNGQFVAVKKLKILEGDDGKEFINEVLSMSRTNHVNIVTLLGFCCHGKKRALVFEFLPNGSLEKYIRGGESTPSLECETMFNIAVGIAKGLDYLHRGCNTQILHFDIKPHNILLDEDFHPKISDFGTARLCPPKYSMISMSVARGTIGYIAPEVVSRNFGSVSHKSDVYSYGMMLLDMVFGKKNIGFNAECDETLFFPEWVYNRLEDEVAANGIHCDYHQGLERKMILVSLWCIQTYSSSRPPMNKVVEMLEGSLELLPMPSKPHLSSPARSVLDTSIITSNSMNAR